MKVHTIFFVEDQAESTKFYQAILGMDPILNVPGMSEFKLSEEHVLGLMPAAGIKRLLGEKIEMPEKKNSAPNAELYLCVNDPNMYFDRALKNGAREMSPVEPRNWGSNVGYVMDVDNNLIAFSN